MKLWDEPLSALHIASSQCTSIQKYRNSLRWSHQRWTSRPRTHRSWQCNSETNHCWQYTSRNCNAHRSSSTAIPYVVLIEGEQVIGVHITHGNATLRWTTVGSTHCVIAMHVDPAVLQFLTLVLSKVNKQVFRVHISHRQCKSEKNYCWQYKSRHRNGRQSSSTAIL